MQKNDLNPVLPRLAAFLALIALPLIYFLPAVLGKITLVPGDGLTQNLGVRVLLGHMIAEGQLPLWNPYIFAGMPLLASIYPGALYPPNWVFAFFSPTTAMNIVVITTYHLALIGTYLYARRIGLTRVGALVTGVSFAFGGFMIAHMGHTSRIAAAAWLPWILLAIEHLYQRASWRWIALGSVFVALQLFAGEPQMNFYTIIVCAAYGLFSLILREQQERRLRFLAGAAAMAFCGALLSMIQLLPERELLKFGQRSGIDYETFSFYSFPPAHIFSLVTPYFFGGASLKPYSIPYWGRPTFDETCGYFGLVTLLCALTAIFGARQRALLWFWVGAALGSLILSFGGYLPFEINHILHQTPVYNLFRASGRHMYEFTFSMAVLGGLGVSCLANMNRERVKRILKFAVFTFIAILAITIIAYRFFGDYLAGETPRPSGANLLATPEMLFPLGVALLSLLALYVHARRNNAFSGFLVVIVLFADLAFFSLSFNWGWREFVSGVSSRLQDPPTVQFIKSRESDLNAFRVAGYSPALYSKSYDLLNNPNISIVRGLQSINGYDALKLNRVSEISGDTDVGGFISDATVFGESHQGFNLLNVKYLLRERPSANDQARTIEIDGVRFNRDRMYQNLTQGSRLEAAPGGVAASELALVTFMGNSVHIPDATVVTQIRLHTKDGRVIDREIQAGRDTAEWAYDYPKFRAVIKHGKPKVAESEPAEGFSAHRFLARILFDRAEIERIEFDHSHPDASLVILRAALFDATNGQSRPLDMFDFYTGRWRKLAGFDDVEIYENLKFKPRAWFVRRAEVALSKDVLQIIKTGQMKDGTPFDPAETVLFEKEDFGNREISLPQISDPSGAEVKVTRYEPNFIELQTRNPQPGFLALSEVYYRGWEARIDGRHVSVERVNYALRGVATPPGNHRVEFTFRAHSFRNGALYSALGALLLVAGWVVSKRRR